MRVLHVDSGREMRGGQWQALRLVEGLGDASTLLAPSGSPLLRAAGERGLAVEPLTIGALASHARRAELVHAHDARSHTWAAGVTGAPLIVARRVGFPVRAGLLSRWKYARPCHYIAVSNFVRRTLEEAGVPGEKISVVYDGVELPAREAAGDRIIALDSGDPMKGSDLIRQAAALSGLPVEFVTALDSALERAAVFVYISRAEGLGSAALRAMAAGVPVVASRIGGLPEIVLDGVNGVLCENEPAAIAEAIRSALELAPRLRASARRHVAGGFTAAHMVDNTRRVYERVIRC